MKIKLLALDLDGTLLERDSTLPEENRLAVAEALVAGIDVVLVTGRSWRATKPIYDALGLTGPAICYLGALVVADGSGRIRHYRPLMPEAWERLREMAVTERLSVTACVAVDEAVAEGDLPGQDLVAADTAYATCPASDFRGWEDWNPYTEVVPDLAPCQAPPIMAAVYGDRAVRRVLAAFPDGLPQSQFDLTDRIAGETVLHIWHDEVDKRRALEAFCRERGIRPEEVAAIGDAPMDAGMIAWSGLGVAVPEAHPAAKAAARRVEPAAAAIRRIVQETR